MYSSINRTKKMKHKFLRLALSLLILLPTACDEDKEPTSYAPTLLTGNVAEYTRFDAVLTGSAVENPNSTTQCAIGFLISTSASLADAQTVESDSRKRQQSVHRTSQ